MARVFQTYDYGAAHIKIAIVDNPGFADLWVYRVSSWGMAYGDGLWYITRNQQDASTWAYFGSIGMSQVKIFFVASLGQAGWQKQHHLQGKFR